VFPLVPRGKVPLISKADGGNGCLDATTDQETIRGWWSKSPAANIGIATGDGLLVVDVDGDEGAITLDALCRDHGDLPVTRCSATGRKEGGGFHFLFAATGPGVRATKLGPALETRGKGGYIVAGGSTHETGRRYVMNDAEIAPAPDWLLELVEPKIAEQRSALAELRVSDDTTPYGRTAIERECEKLRDWPKGDRNNQLNRAAFSLGQLEAGGEIAWGDAGPALEAAALAARLPAGPSRKTIYSSGLVKGRESPRKAPERDTRPLRARANPVGDARRAAALIETEAVEASRTGSVDRIARILEELGDDGKLAYSDAAAAVDRIKMLARTAAQQLQGPRLARALRVANGSRPGESTA
jgi:hypothetical protein